MRRLRALLLIFALTAYNSQAFGQVREVIGGNIVNTTMTGALLGAATLGLQGGVDYAPPLRVGVGLGILSGVALAGYDMVAYSANGSLIVEGTFISGNNTGLILLIDTIYGGMTGAVIGTAIILISNGKLLDGLQYGASIGAWTGFGYGLVDAFALNLRSGDYSDSDLGANYFTSESTDSHSKGMEMRFFQPRVNSYPSFRNNTLQREFKTSLDVMNVTLRF